MKKLVLMFVAIAAISFASCGNKTQPVEAEEPDTVAVDTAVVDSAAVDSTATEAPAEEAAPTEESAE